jgi:hypothetical protein
MKKQLIFLSILCFPFIYNYSQALKSMTSDYDDGKITYQYYEDSKTAEFIKNGLFKFQKNLIGNGTFKETITGTFNHGFKDGMWTFTILKLDFPNEAGSYTTETTNLIQTYKDGVANGEWKLNSSYKTRNKQYYKGEYSWSAYSRVVSEFVTTNFINGHVSGVTTYKNPESTSSKTITFNKDGFVVGNYIFKEYSGTSEVNFTNEGIVTKSVGRGEDGSILSKMDFDDELISTVQKYTKGEITNEQLNKRFITLETISSYNIADFETLFKHDYFILPGLGGNKIENSYGKYILAKKFGPIDINSNSFYSDARQSLRPESYSEFLRENSSKMSETDILKVKSEREKLENIVNFKNKFEDNCTKINEKFPISEKLSASNYISLSTRESLVKELHEIDSIGIEIRKNIKSEDSKMREALEARFNFQSTDFFTFNYKKITEISEMYLMVIDKDIIPRVDNVKATMMKADKAFSVTENIVQDFGLIISEHTYSGENVRDLTKKQKELIDVYFEINTYLNQQLKTSKDIITTNSILDNIIIVNQKIQKLKDTDLKELLKAINKSKSTVEKFNLIKYYIS